MKVKELIERLQSLDQDLDAYVYNEKESSLFLVNTVNQTCDYGESENGEDEWEDFVTIFPTTNSQPLFTLTAEEVEIVKKALLVAKEAAEPLIEALEMDISKTNIPAINNLLKRIKTMAR